MYYKCKIKNNKIKRPYHPDCYDCWKKCDSSVAGLIASNEKCDSSVAGLTASNDSSDLFDFPVASELLSLTFSSKSTNKYEKMKTAARRKYPLIIFYVIRSTNGRVGIFKEYI